MTYTKIWQSLEISASEQATGYVRRRVKPQSVCGIFLAVAKPSNQHVLQLQLMQTSPVIAPSLPSARGLDVRVIRSENGHNGFTIQLAVREPRYGHIFDALVDDIVEIIAGAKSEPAAVAAFISRLRHWQKFLEQVGPDGLSREAQQGLYGELWFLRERLIPLVGLHPALLAWVGPSGAHQDFLLRSCAIEVKTTGTKEPQYLTIQSERQLDDTVLDALFLFHLSLDIRECIGESLIDIIESLRQVLQADTAALDLYEDRLLDVGFLQSQNSHYEKVGYNVRSANLFRVRDAFPRIIEVDLKPGVGSVRYSIATAACHSFLATEDELKSQLIGFTHGK